MHNKISKRIFRVWVDKWVIVNNLRKTTLLYAFFHYELKVIFMGISSSGYPTNTIGTCFWCPMVWAK